MKNIFDFDYFETIIHKGTLHNHYYNIYLLICRTLSTYRMASIQACFSLGLMTLSSNISGSAGLEEMR